MSKRPKSKPSRKPAASSGAPAPAASPNVPPEIQAAVAGIRQIARESPEGWGTVATALKEQPDVEPEVLFEFLARNLGKETLPLLRGAALDEDDTFAEAALRALPLLGTRAAGDALTEAYAAYPAGERARLAWQGVEALRARGINVEVPEPEGVRKVVPAYELRETWESLPDAVGSVEVAARLQDRYGVWHAIVVVTNEQAGVKNSMALPLSHREWRMMVERGESEGVAHVETPPEYSRWQVARFRAMNARSGFPLEDRLEAWDQFVGPAPEDYTPPDPLERVRTLAPEEQAALAERTSELLGDEGVVDWGVEPADLRPWHDQWTEVFDRTVGEPNDDEMARENALYAEIVRALITPEMAALFRERLIDTSRKLQWLRNDAAADIAAAVALALDRGEDLAGMQFFYDLLWRGFDMLEEILADGEDPEKYRYDPMQVVDEEAGD